MDSRFAHLRLRDTSVSMLRVKMSRRRSQSQKENRERAVNTRRNLDKLPEMEMSSLDASITMANMSTIQEKTMNTGVTKTKVAAEERLKQLARWRERKVLEKEKEKREKERKGVFKTGMYHPKDTFTVASLPEVSTASTRAKETKVNTVPSQSTRITRSMKQQQQQVQRPLTMKDPNTVAKKAQAAVERSTRIAAAPIKPTSAPTKTNPQVCIVEPVKRALTTRSTSRPPVTAAPAVKDKPKDKTADVRTTRSKALPNAVAPPPGRERKCKDSASSTVQFAVSKETEMQVSEEKPCPTPCQSVPDVDAAEAQSFAPDGFVFQAPIGLSFKFEPLTPRSADAFLSPNLSFSLPPAPVFNTEPQAEPREPSPPEVDPPMPTNPLESKHDVPYFRSEIVNKTERLTSLCVDWEAKVEDESIPEEMRDCMRTAVGQARLLMKERFKQFSGLVDDCELGRGEKITTCTDLQGFWDMVYYQVEDVCKKFDALKEAERRDWVEEHRPPPRQKKVVKKPSATPAKQTGTKAAAKSRLAAVKAAMKAKQQAANEAAKDAGNDEDYTTTNSPEPQPKAEPQLIDPVVFDGGFFKVESPAKPTGSLRRSSRLSATTLPQNSPCSSFLSPRRVTRLSRALAQTPVHVATSPAQATRTPARFCLNLSQTPAHAQTSRSSHNRKDTANVSLCFSPVQEGLSDITPPKGSPECQAESAAELSVPTPSHSLPSISVVADQGTAAEAVDSDFPLSPCKTPLPVSQASGILSCQPFASPLIVTPNQPLISSAVAVQESACLTPDSSVVEDIPGLDIERYLQPSQGCSLSPRETVAVETLSPTALDIEMESPGGETENPPPRQEAALSAVSSVLTPHSPQAQTAESDLLLFTPALKDRIRQSVCPSDLMVFTPPL